ncbi:hypothetical protein I7I51_03700 [Histoplasma capsulatum]|uniref:Heterokaryon incompatibility domain-containing protein n=1 Tax=Ajellomyces capsulatus TaxID=5037 RepID=A0A8A1M750_AJECA|nr:predicted protein [Histoplasma mississippiense (nom. inval.)]EDN07037.1 predicted protein [Histoplasma mississippiense (nom. inval.)]QSS61525.1 hypothetical protein I7I51_03700 [Histoplasma capsulatum]
MPRTIADAITVYLQMGRRYLFVDKFCIIQDAGERIRELCGEREEFRGECSGAKELYLILGTNLGRKTMLADGKALAKVPIVNVMMIEWDGTFGHRREPGFVYLVDWMKLRREWKVIMLP